MSRSVEFHVRFDGEAAGLTTHRLSLAAFNNALGKLLTAFRRIADTMSQGTSTRRESSRRYGRYGEKKFDLQLASISDGCVQLAFRCVLDGQDEELSNAEEGIAQATVNRLLQAITQEWSGVGDASPSVRRYLEALPLGVAKQDYEGRIDGKVFNKVSLGPSSIDEQRKNALPRLASFRGKVSSVRFDPEHGQVRIRDVSGYTHVCRATQDLIEKAVELRHQIVTGKMLVRHDLKRLLVILSEGETAPVPSPEKRIEHIAERWEETLRKLAE